MVTKLAIKYLPLLKRLSKLSTKRRKEVLKAAPKEFIKAVSEGSFNILKGNVPLTKEKIRKLKRQKRNLKSLASKKTSVRVKKNLLQRGGFLGTLAAVLVPLISSVISATSK